jgi:hypothetical protein
MGSKISKPTKKRRLQRSSPLGHDRLDHVAEPVARYRSA